MMLLNRLVAAAALIASIPVHAFAQTPVDSFGQLSTVVSPGTTVVIQSVDGRHLTGKVVSLTPSAIEIERQLSFFRVRKVSISEGSIRRIESRDSTWNGALIGIAVGAAVAAVGCAATSNNPDDWGCLFWTATAPATGVAIGTVVDARIRRPLYVAPPRVQLTPVGGSGRFGVIVALRF